MDGEELVRVVSVIRYDFNLPSQMVFPVERNPRSFGLEKLRRK